jgi:hypothetical protein
MRNESSECAALRAFRRHFQHDAAKKFLTRKFNIMSPAARAFAGHGGLTAPVSSGISHAHAGLAKLRPPLTPTQFDPRFTAVASATLPFRASRNEGRSVATTAVTQIGHAE